MYLLYIMYHLSTSLIYQIDKCSHVGKSYLPFFCNVEMNCILNTLTNFVITSAAGRERGLGRVLCCHAHVTLCHTLTRAVCLPRPGHRDGKYRTTVKCLKPEAWQVILIYPATIKWKWGILIGDTQGVPAASEHLLKVFPAPSLTLTEGGAAQPGCTRRGPSCPCQPIRAQYCVSWPIRGRESVNILTEAVMSDMRSAVSRDIDPGQPGPGQWAAVSGQGLSAEWAPTLEILLEPRHRTLERHGETQETMGNESSLPLELGATFDADEIKRLGKR